MISAMPLGPCSGAILLQEQQKVKANSGQDFPIEERAVVALERIAAAKQRRGYQDL
jgi:predicted DNA-binding WGR domain protein